MKRKLFAAENIIGGRIFEAVRHFEIGHLIGSNYIVQRARARAISTYKSFDKFVSKQRQNLDICAVHNTVE